MILKVFALGMVAAALSSALRNYGFDGWSAFVDYAAAFTIGAMMFRGMKRGERDEL